MDRPRTDSWNFAAILGQTVTMGAGRQLGSPHVVLPYLLVASGGSVFAGALIVPIVELFRLLGFAGMAPVVREARGVKWHLALVLCVSSAAIAAVGIAASSVSPQTLSNLILGAAAILGFGIGAMTLVHQDLLGRLLSETRRDKLMYGEAIAAGALAIAIAVISHVQLAHEPPLHRHVAILAACVLVMAASALLVAVVKEQPVNLAEDRTRSKLHGEFFSDFKTGITKVLEARWAQQFIVARVLFLSVELALPFYVIHAAVHYTQVGAGLTVLLIATSAAMILGGALWRWIELPSRTVMIAGAIFAALGGLLAAAIDLFPQLQILALHGLVLFLVALGSVSIVMARSLYVISMSPSIDRPYYVAVSSVCAITAGIFLAFCLGLMAQWTNFAWPIYCLMALTVASGIWAAWLPDARTRGNKQGEKGPPAVN
ncbi:MAG: hypothetical protein AAF978_09865 [Cyanobacteria bacterium P01_E01_bin.48]